MTFQAISGEVVWKTPEPVTLTISEVNDLLAIFDAHDAPDLWRALNNAAVEAGYPPSITSMKAA